MWLVVLSTLNSRLFAPSPSSPLRSYGVIRSDLERRGLPIGPLDTMIAAHALRLHLPLVTNNTSEFARVPGLSLEDWTK